MKPRRALFELFVVDFFRDIPRPGAFSQESPVANSMPSRVLASLFRWARLAVVVLLVVSMWGHWLAVTALLSVYLLPAIHRYFVLIGAEVRGWHTVNSIHFYGIGAVTVLSWVAYASIPLLCVYWIVSSDDLSRRVFCLAGLYLWLLDFEVRRYYGAQRTLSAAKNGEDPLFFVLRQMIGNRRDVSVLEVACGVGGLLEDLTTKLGVSRDNLAGIDFHEPSIRVGKERCPEFDLRVGNTTAIPFDSESFDIVICKGAPNDSTVGNKGLDEMFRVCRTGGSVVLLDEQLARGASWIEKQWFYRSVAFASDYHWNLDEAPINFLPPTAGNLRVAQLGPYYYALSAEKLQRVSKSAE